MITLQYVESKVLLKKNLAVDSSSELLCRYRKRTDIYYSTWSFENLPVSVFRPTPKTHTLTIFGGGYKKVYRPPNTHTN